MHLKYPRSVQVQLYLELTRATTAAVIVHKPEHIQQVFVPTVFEDAKKIEEFNVLFLEHHKMGYFFNYMHCIYNGSINHFVSDLLWSGVNYLGVRPTVFSNVAAQNISFQPALLDNEINVNIYIYIQYMLEVGSQLVSDQSFEQNKVAFKNRSLASGLAND